MTHAAMEWLAVKKLPAEHTRRGYTHMGHFNTEIKLNKKKGEEGREEKPMLTE
jgi:hypothetical protein